MNQPAINRTKLRINRNCYLPDRCRKDLIVLHGTAGSSAQSAVETWRLRSNLVSTPYVIDHDGVIYETYDPSLWSFHLGLSASLNPMGRHDRRSIGIELVNAGPLQRKGDSLMWWPQAYGSRFCRMDDTHRYTESAFRGFNYFAAYTEPQYEALLRLLPYIATKYGIPLIAPQPEQRLITNAAGFAAFSGILAHTHFRKDKFDVGPAFDWDRLDPVLAGRALQSDRQMA